MGFTSFNFHSSIQSSLKEHGFTTPTPIQAQAIPLVLAGHDLMGLAQTGTGKTAAFVLPILERLSKTKSRDIRALILAPTRELAQQIHEVVASFGKKLGLRSATAYGGVSMYGQVQEFRRGIDILVACPGRLIDHIERRTVWLDKVEVLVLDEADQMFDMGFLPNVRQVLKTLPRERQTLLFSATMPEAVSGLAREILRNPETVKVGHSAPVSTVSHAIYPVPQHLKSAILLGLLKETDTESVLVFTRTKHRAKRVALQLKDHGFKATSLQGNLSQNQRQAAMSGFRNGQYQILVATDIAARGIDISSISHVINYDIPHTVEAYTHRIGRTGRAASTGDALTLVGPEDTFLVRSIERVLGKPIIRKTLEGFDYKAKDSVLNQGARQDHIRERTPRSRGRSWGNPRASSERRASF